MILEILFAIIPNFTAYPFFSVFLQIISSLEHFRQQCPNVSTTPITAMGCRQCLHLSVVQLKDEHYRKLHCLNGVDDTFEHGYFEKLLDIEFTVTQLS